MRGLERMPGTTPAASQIVFVGIQMNSKRRAAPKLHNATLPGSK
jgi:hypothetical protein